WDEAVASAEAAGLEIQLGCKTVELAEFRAYLARSERLPSKLLRMVFEREDGAPPSRDDVVSFLERAFPLLEASGVRLAIENHFDLPSRVLAEAVAPYPPSRIGFCIDTANSLRNFESPEQVLDLLGGRAYCYHLKDFRVLGDKLGFRVEGAPLGQGRLDLNGVLRRIFAHDPEPLIFVENWTPSTGDWKHDVAEDDRWLRQSLAALRESVRGM
ncbi:MAG: TIM barrel protein, partial [Acidobacteria bacterium]|nr:TIM barrel protein [Acidobacteriota bacterium]